MKYLLIFLLLAQIKDEKNLWQKIKNFYFNLRTISGDFLQRECDEETGVCLEYRGRFYIKKPHYLRLEIKEPERWVVIGDKDSIYFYYKDSLTQRLPISEFNPFLIFFTITQDTVIPKIKEKNKKYYLLNFPFKEYQLNLQIRKKELLIDKIDYQWEKRKLEIFLYSQKLNKALTDSLFLKR